MALWKQALCKSVNANLINIIGPRFSPSIDSYFLSTSPRRSTIDLCVLPQMAYNPWPFNLQFWMGKSEAQKWLHMLQATQDQATRKTTRSQASETWVKLQSPWMHTPHLSQEVPYLCPDCSQLFGGSTWLCRAAWLALLSTVPSARAAHPQHTCEQATEMLARETSCEPESWESSCRCLKRQAARWFLVEESQLFVNVFQISWGLKHAKSDLSCTWNLKPCLVTGPGAGLTDDLGRRFWRLWLQLSFMQVDSNHPKNHLLSSQHLVMRKLTY